GRTHPQPRRRSRPNGRAYRSPHPAAHPRTRAGHPAGLRRRLRQPRPHRRRQHPARRRHRLRTGRHPPHHRRTLTTPYGDQQPTRPPRPSVQPPAEGRGPNLGTPTMLRSTLRLTAIGLIVLALGFGGGAAGAYLMLDDTTWTDTRPARPPATASTAPTPAAPTAPADPTARWRLGSCLTDALQPTACQPGAGVWHIVGVVQDPGPDPCTGIPGQPATRTVGDIALCLTRH